MRRLFVLLLSLCSVWFCAESQRREVFVPMDYSHCGYRASESDIPNVPTVVRVSPSADDWTSIMSAIYLVSRHKPDAQGRRGAVLLGPGEFRISQPLRIAASGVVLRGMGRDATRILYDAPHRAAVIYVEGGPVETDTSYVSVNQEVPSGATSLCVTGDWSVGDDIMVVRPCTDEWIDHLGMKCFGGGLDYTGWKRGDFVLRWQRRVVAVVGDSVVLDSPITSQIAPEFGGAFVHKVLTDNRVSEVGIEDLGIESVVASGNPKDEDHAWDGIWMENVRDCWVRGVSFSHFAGSAVALQAGVSRVTVEDCVSRSPVSEIGGWRRRTFTTRGQQTLFQRCVSHEGINDFSVGMCASGPNAFVQCEAVDCRGGFSGSVGSWACGLLMDVVDVDGGDIRLGNLEQWQMGTGWSAASSMLWQCTASTIACYSPDPAHRCSAHGCWGCLTGNAEWTSSNDHVAPRSLFYAQLEKRGVGRSGHLLPRNTRASSSPSVAVAQELAAESRTVPRLTLEAWIDSLDARRGVGARLEGVALMCALPSSNVAEAFSWGVPAVGGRYVMPWWNGRVKDNFVAEKAKPAVTRFVPGREGVGLTDRIDSVVAYMKVHNLVVLDHNYGLWYDLRRTDHERVRRADAEVCAPFYEQPFARSGQGVAWDGLSLYDLSQPNRWYWSRLRCFAQKALPVGITLFNEHYFQHNILEAGAHWVDSPWRPVNNVNNTYDFFSEPVPYAGDKRVFMAEQFYDLSQPRLRELHRSFIRMNLDQLKDCPNVVHSVGAEYTGPIEFVRFWLETIVEWEAETGHDVRVSLGCTKDAQDSILANPRLAAAVDVVDVRLWHYNTTGLWAPEAGRNLAPRQWMRQVKPGTVGVREAYKTVAECRRLHPDKLVTYFSQNNDKVGWGVLMAGGSLANVVIRDPRLVGALPSMSPAESNGCWTLADKHNILVYRIDCEAEYPIPRGRCETYIVDEESGMVSLVRDRSKLKDAKIWWIRIL